jgi:pantoate--beta-alanine ligase
MKIVELVADLRSSLSPWRRLGETIGFVPTMGNLHEGHLALVEQALERSDRVVVSIFVNPMQFGQGEDFDAYPRTLEQDCQRLAPLGVDVVYTPTAATMYPRNPDASTRVAVPGLSDQLCGASRPGHFVGVATIVCKLFNQLQPDIAFLGEKDYQQLLIIRRMVEDLDMDIEIVGCPIVREADGLAMSSRNGYLSETQRQQAPLLYQRLSALTHKLIHPVTNFADLEREAVQALDAEGFCTDYIAIRRQSDLAPPGPADRDLVVLAAAYLGNTRLIDNIQVNGIP